MIMIQSNSPLCFAGSRLEKESPQEQNVSLSLTYLVFLLGILINP